MNLSTFLIVAVALLSAFLTRLLWVRVRRKVHTDTHAVIREERADPSDTRVAYPADETHTGG